MAFAFLDGNLVKQSMESFADPAGGLIQVVSLDNGRAAYRASASFTPTATGAVTLLSMVGNASKQVRIRRFILSGHSTANAQETFALQRTSVLGAGGTAVNPTPAKLDPNSPSPAINNPVAHYTSTLKAAGTANGGPISTFDFWTSVVTTPTVGLFGQAIFPEYATDQGQSIVLRGPTDFLELQNVNAGNLSAGTVLQYVIEWEEDNS